MRRRTFTAVTLGLVILATATPIGIALWQARRQGLNAEFARAVRQADEILRRSEASSSQILRGFDAMSEFAADRCSPRAIAAMRKIDLGSSMIQTFGHVEGGKLKCSSFGWHDPPLEIISGKEVATRDGRRIRPNVQLPILPGSRFIAVQQGSYVAILHKDLVVDPGELAEGLLAGTFYDGDHGLLATRGSFDLRWPARAPRQSLVTFVDGGYAVAVLRSPSFNVGAVAAVPMTDVSSHVRFLTLLLVPFGAAAGLLLAWAVHRLAQWQRSMPSVLRGALRRDEFFVVYEPIVDVRTGAWIGAEALIRWRRPNGEMVRPDLFIPVAEESGLIEQITATVLSKVEREAGVLFARRPGFRLSVNLSASDLHSERSASLVRAFVERHRLAAGQLVVEISERGVLQTEVAQQFIREFRAGGVSVAIDDFGTGYSCLSYLASLELDILKIDKAFVDSLGTLAPTSQVALHIIAMAKALDLRLIAEGVETQAQLDFLRQHHVELAQGYLFSKPMRIDAFVERLDEQAGTVDSRWEACAA